MSAFSSNRIELMEAAFASHEDASLFLQLADAYREAGDHERALRVLRRGMENHPESTVGFVLLGRILAESGRPAEAIVCLERLLELEPGNEEGQELLGQLKPVPPPPPPPAPEAPSPLPSTMTLTPSSPPPAEAPQAPMPWEMNDTKPATKNGAGNPAPATSPTPEETALQDSLSATHGHNHDDALAGVGHVDSTAVALSDLLVGLLEYRDPFFRGGTSLTRLLTTAIARELKVEDDALKAIALGAVLRDLGQLPLKGLINKPGTELGQEGRKKMEQHVETALDMLAGVKLPPITVETIRHHHERWDGKGYPSGLSGDAIPLGARIVAVADSFGAMIAARPHRLPKRVPAALEDVKGGAGTQYDPAVVQALVNVINTTGWKGPGFALRHHVLIVDPDETRAMVIATKLCSNGYLAEAAFSVQAAHERLEKTRLAALIVSSDLPDMEESTLLRQVRENARLGMIPVLMTDTGVSERVLLLEDGADVCLNRGASFEELEATLKALLRREGKGAPAAASGGKSADAPWSGLQGDIQDFPLGWLLQVLNYDSRTAAVFLVGDGDEGAIWLEKGNPRHAQTKSLAGEEAFRAMLLWKHGQFSVDPEARSEQLTIKTSLMNLLLDQAVQEDHAAFFGQVQT